MPSVLELRQQIKDWEHQFQKDHGRTPSKEDIKKDVKVRDLYKQYQKLKKSNQDSIPKLKEPPSPHDENSPSKPTKRTPLMNYSLNQVSELGPTPQANGKVLSIFDIQASVTPPESSPLKLKRMTNTTSLPAPLSNIKDGADISPFKTPTKPRRLDFTQQQTPSRNNNLLVRLKEANSSPVPTPQVIRQSSTLQDTVTPTKNSRIPDLSSYNDDLVPQSFQISPSPLKLHRFLNFGESKRMASLYNDYQKIKNEPLSLEVGEDITEIETKETQVSNESNESDSFKLYRKKSKTQKRTTRNWHIKPRPELQIDKMEGKNVHEVVRDQNRTYLSEEELSSEEEFDSDEELELQKQKSMAATDNEPGKKKPISMNFKRYKINDPRARAFKKRMRA